jgi:hypothetical protein
LPIGLLILGESSQSFMAEKGLDKEGEPSSYGIWM